MRATNRPVRKVLEHHDRAPGMSVTQSMHIIHEERYGGLHKHCENLMTLNDVAKV